MMQWKRLSQTALAGLLGLALLVGFNVLAAKQDWRWDATKTKRYSLAPETVGALENLDAEVVAAAFYRPEERVQVQDLLDRFRQKSDKFSYEFVDPDRAALRAKEYQVTQTGTVVLLSGDKQEKLVFPDEEKLINGVIRVTNPYRAKLYFVQGHGEVDPAAGDERSAGQLTAVLKEQGADIEPLTLARQEAVPDDADVLFILGPQKDFLEHEIEVLQRYWDNGGRVFIALSAENRTNMDDWLKNTGLKRLDGFVLDPVSKLIVGDPVAPLVQDYGPSPITSDFGLMTIFPTAAALSAITPEQQGENPPPLAGYLGRSTEQSWLETDVDGLRASGTAVFDENADVPGPLWIAAVYQGDAADQAGSQDAQAAPKKKRETRRAVVFADQDFLTDQYVGLSGNMDLARNSANWLMEREGLITVSKPEAANVFLMLSVPARMLVSWTPLLFIPGLCLALAIFVGLGRRRVK